MKKKIKIIDILCYTSTGDFDKLPKKIKYEDIIYTFNKDIGYYYDEDGARIGENQILDMCLNDEVEILDEEDEFEDIEECFAAEGLSFNKNALEYKINQLIKNQKKIIERLKKEGK